MGGPVACSSLSFSCGLSCLVPENDVAGSIQRARSWPVRRECPGLFQRFYSRTHRWASVGPAYTSGAGRRTWCRETGKRATRTLGLPRLSSVSPTHSTHRWSRPPRRVLCHPDPGQLCLPHNASLPHHLSRLVRPIALSLFLSTSSTLRSPICHGLPTKFVLCVNPSAPPARTLPSLHRQPNSNGTLASGYNKPTPFVSTHRTPPTPDLSATTLPTLFAANPTHH